MSRTVKIRDVKIGGENPIAIQSMTSADARDEKAVMDQIRRLEDAGCDIVRLAVPDQEALDVFGSVRTKTDMPLVADIHFDYRLAIGAMEKGADKIRINPGNIGDVGRVKEVVRVAKERSVPIRVGVNGGSLEKDIVEKNGGVTAEGLAESAIRNLKIIEDMGYEDLVVSIKSSDVAMNYRAHILAAEKTDHPFHVGITESGIPERGKVKSAAGIGALLLAGVGDTIRVSLTADPVEEVLFARQLLEAIGERKADYDLVSCPTCGRTRIDLQALTSEVDRMLSEERDLPKGLTVAVMGCVVNGPGEAGEADYGVCGGDGKGAIIVKGEVVRTVPEKELARALMEEIRRN